MTPSTTIGSSAARIAAMATSTVESLALAGHAEAVASSKAVAHMEKARVIEVVTSNRPPVDARVVPSAMDICR